ncbi:helix-turn-helix domain-containing protein [Actinokineospora inagensis]|uniref:transposase family protein n=1 Tax=Actinokineospora inagensis TaxID=103730 RepID=UPI001FE052D4|nr:transposase family protein [Actinokineospora inagensis]
MCHATGLARVSIENVCAAIHHGTGGPTRRWPPVSGLFTSVVVTLAYLRRDRVQAELAEAFGVSRSTISRAITALTPVLGEILHDCIPTADDVDDEVRPIVDGTLLPCRSWASRPGLYSKRHRRTRGRRAGRVYRGWSDRVGVGSDRRPPSRHAPHQTVGSLGRSGHQDMARRQRPHRQ